MNKVIDHARVRVINALARFMSKKILDGKQWNHLNITLKNF
jgi:hypothetical protein